MKTLVMIALMASGIIGANAQKSKMEVDILTSAQCGMCEERIEEHLQFVKGIKSADLDLKTKKVHVSYDPFKITPEMIRQEIASLGYDADEMVKNDEAYHKLPKCCQHGSSCNHK